MTVPLKLALADICVKLIDFVILMNPVHLAEAAMDLEVRHLKLVTAISAEGSVTAAARRLHLTQSALSHQLRQIENRLGGPLFERLSRKMVLTPAGERLRQTAEQVLAELERAEGDIQRARETGREEIRLSTQCYTCYHWLPSRLRLFHRRFPKASVRIVTEATRNPFEALLQGDLDVAIVLDAVRHRMLAYEPLFEDEQVVVVSRNHPHAKAEHFPLEAFSQETLLLFPPSAECSLLKRFLLPAGVFPRQIQQIHVTEAIVELVKSGAGVSVMPKWAVAPELRAGEVRVLRLGTKGWHRNWSAALHRRRERPAYLEAFVHLLARYPLSADASPSPRR
jgi:LysR family transcriptional regulator for metE and metH